jgi:hypothetical protein
VNEGNLLWEDGDEVLVCRVADIENFVDKVFRKTGSDEVTTFTARKAHCSMKCQRNGQERKRRALCQRNPYTRFSRVRDAANVGNP